MNIYRYIKIHVHPYTTISPQSLGMYLLSHVKPRSTIDAVELNFCVRNGNRCTLHAIHTKTLRRNLVYLQFSPLELRLNVLFTFLYERNFLCMQYDDIASVSIICFKLLFIPTNQCSSKNKKHI